MNGFIPSQFAPGQAYPGGPGARPPKNWIPFLDTKLTLLGVFDNSDGYWKGLPLQALVEALLVAESLHTEDRIDERNKIELEIASGTEADTTKTKEYEIPSGEVWWINRFNLVTPAEVQGNIRISKFPKSDDVAKKYLGTDQAVSSDINYDLAAAGQLGADLRLVGGDKITVVGTTTVLTTDVRTVTLNIYGRKARRLV